MDMKQYLLSVIASGIIFSIAQQLVGNKGTIAVSIKFITGIFLAITVISPLLGISLKNMSDLFSAVESEAGSIVASAETANNAQQHFIIKDKLEAYILEEATSLGADISVDVSVSDDTIPLPVSVTIEGQVAPYTRSHLSSFIEKNLGISKEHQLWS